MSRVIKIDKTKTEQQIQEIVNWIKKYFIENGTSQTKAVIGISGGKDSTVAAALLVRALGPERVIGVLMPQGHQSDLDDSIEVCKILGIQYSTINIGPTCDELFKSFTANTGLPLNSQMTTNAPSRVRMNVLYMVAAAVGGRVCNTGNKSEAYIGYTTKYGDLAGDFALLKNFTVREVYMIGDALREIPAYLIHKAPADGMSGKTDEENIGLTYDEIDDYILEAKIPDSLEKYENLINRHKRNVHKTNAVDLPAPCACWKQVHYENMEDEWI